MYQGGSSDTWSSTEVCKRKIIKEWSQKSSFPERLQGRTGVIEGERGRSYVVKIKDQNKEKEFL